MGRYKDRINFLFSSGRKLGQAGMSLIELAVSLGILSIVMYQFISGSNFLTTFYSSTQNTLAMEDVALTVYENIRGNINLYQVDFDSTKFLNTTSYADLQTKLPFAWNSKKIIESSTCATACPAGRLGYIIYPISGYRGLLRLTIRITHPELLKDGFKDYTFLITGN